MRPLLAFWQDPGQDVRAVGHNDIDPEIEQAAHLGGIVYRPHLYSHSPGVGSIQKARRDQRDPLVFYRHLEPFVVRSTVAPWMTTISPSRVMWTSSFSPLAPASTATRKATKVFSGPMPPPPRYTMLTGQSSRKEPFLFV